MDKITEYLNKIEQTDVRNERITHLGDLFIETHTDASDDDKNSMYKRIVRLLKLNHNDYYELAKVIYDTKFLKGDGNHWNYITAVMRNKKVGNVRERN